MMQPGAVLVEATAPARLGIDADQDPRPAADAVDDVVRLDERLHLEEVAELLPEGDARRLDRRHLDVRDAVHLDAHASSFIGRCPSGAASAAALRPAFAGPSPCSRWPSR